MINLPRAPRQSYKTFLWDYDNLLTYSDEECCFSLSEREIQILLAQLDTIAWKTRYKPTNTEISQDTIDRWYGNLARKLMSGCCPDDNEIHRYLPDGTYQSSIDGGATWFDDPEGDPRHAAPHAPPLTGAPSPAKRCAAADNVRDQYLQMRNNTMELLSGGTTVLLLVAFMVGAIGGILSISVVGVSFGVILFSLAGWLLSLTPASVEAQIDTTALDAFRCIIYCHMDYNGQVSDEALALILSEIASQFNDFPETFFYSITASLGATGLSNAGAMGLATASDCGGCDCDEGCLDPDNFTFGTITSTVINPDGSITFELNSEDNGAGTQCVIWKQYQVKGECCQILAFQIHTTGGTPEYYWSMCTDNAGTYNVGFNFPGGCMFFAQVIQNFALATPFTLTMTVGAHCGD